MFVTFAHKSKIKTRHNRGKNTMIWHNRYVKWVFCWNVCVIVLLWKKGERGKNERKKMHSWFYLSMDLGLKFSLIFFVYPIFVWDLVFRRNFNLVFVTKKKKTIFQLILCHQLFVQIKKNSKEKEIYTFVQNESKTKFLKPMLENELKRKTDWIETN